MVLSVEFSCHYKYGSLGGVRSDLIVHWDSPVEKLEQLFGNRFLLIKCFENLWFRGRSSVIIYYYTVDAHSFLFH